MARNKKSKSQDRRQMALTHEERLELISVSLQQIDFTSDLIEHRSRTSFDSLSRMRNSFSMWVRQELRA
jgi:hypothetical protein